MTIPFCAKWPFAAVCLQQICAMLYGAEATKGGFENLFSNFLLSCFAAFTATLDFFTAILYNRFDDIKIAKKGEYYITR